MRRLPPLTSLRAFEAAARLGSFRLAAIELGVTPTAVSHHIRGLEVDCGQSLFRRRPRPVALTPYGEALFPVIRDGLDRFAAAIDQIRPAKAAKQRLRVSTTNAFAARCLVPLLPKWCAEHPNLELEVIGTDSVLDLRAGQADVALRYAREAPRDLDAIELARDRFHVVGAATLVGALSRSRWQTLPRIACDWPAHDSLAPTWERYDNVAGSSGPGAGRTVLRFREELHGIEAVIAGQGIGILSDLLVARELESGVLVSLSTVTLEGYGIYLVLSPGQLSLPPMREFADWMRAVYADPAPPQKTRLVGTEPYQP